MAALVVAATLLSGCSVVRLEQLPAPAGVSGPVYKIKAQFADVENLTEGAKVKLQGVVVGEVTSITTKDYVASVAMNIAKRFPLAKSATFQIRFTTPLGEDYVSVSSPAQPGTSVLAGNAVVPLAQTTEAPGIEDTFAALSLLLNGGGLDNIKTIVTELEAALSGRTSAARDSIARLDTVLSNFDAHKADLDKTLDGLRSLSKTLAAGTGLITDALQTFPATFQLLAQDTSRISQLLPKVATLGSSVKGLLDQSQSVILTDVDELHPTLDSLRASAADLLPTMTSLISFGRLFDRAAPGDYLNIDATVEFLLDAPAQRPTLPAATTATSSDAFSQLLSEGTG
ncbi:MCE family protein [Jatrophihabitans sp.]|uniref:MCE family protein n=1 Tax=Jatrophihabitans sp. TaxID=1932789 RepID=UPI0030C738A5|nr:mammalian cell entry protein [Jatrophihabitans sp.]